MGRFNRPAFVHRGTRNPSGIDAAAADRVPHANRRHEAALAERAPSGNASGIRRNADAAPGAPATPSRADARRSGRLKLLAYAGELGYTARGC